MGMPIHTHPFVPSSTIWFSCDVTVVPILVGAINKAQEAEYGSILAPYLADPGNFFVVSSDFCHWRVIPCRFDAFFDSIIGALVSATLSTIPNHFLVVLPACG